jgi:hypothetical protein
MKRNLVKLGDRFVAVDDIVTLLHLLDHQTRRCQPCESALENHFHPILQIQFLAWLRSFFILFFIIILFLLSARTEEEGKEKKKLAWFWLCFYYYFILKKTHFFRQR